MRMIDNGLNSPDLIIEGSGEPETEGRVPYSAGAVNTRVIELLFYLVIVAAAALLRFSELDMVPLSSSESSEALAVFQFWHPDSAAQPVSSPAYFTLTGILGQLVGLGDITVRLVPAMAGIVLVLLPNLIRHRLGRLGTMVTALFLAVSPLLVSLSRQAGGNSLALFAGLLLFISWIRYRESSQQRWFYAMGASLALGVTTSPLFYSMLLGIGATWLLESTVGPRLTSAPDRDDPAPWTLPAGPILRRFLLVSLGTFALLSTTFLTNLSGLGTAAQLLPEWVRSFGFPAQIELFLSPILIIARYETAVLLLGTMAVIWATWREEPFGSLIAYWLVAGLLLALFQSTQTAYAAVIVAPAFLLIGTICSRYLNIIPTRTTLFLTCGLVLGAVVIYVNLSRFARLMAYPDSEAADSTPYYVSMIAVALVLMGTALVVLWNWDEKAVRQGALAALVILLFSTSFATARYLGQDAANDTRERWVASATDDELNPLTSVLEDLSWKASGSPVDVEIFSAVDTPVLRWYLRDYTQATFGSSVAPSTDSPLVISAETENPVFASNYFGADFGLERTATPHRLAGLPTLRWWLFHESTMPINENRVILWVRSDLVETSP